MVLINGQYCRNLQDALDVIQDQELKDGLQQLIYEDRKQTKDHILEKVSQIAQIDIDCLYDWI